MAHGVPNGSQVCPSAIAVIEVEEAAFEDVAVPQGPLRQAPVMKLAVVDPVAVAQGPLRQAPVRVRPCAETEATNAKRETEVYILILVFVND